MAVKRHFEAVSPELTKVRFLGLIKRLFTGTAHKYHLFTGTALRYQ